MIERFLSLFPQYHLLKRSVETLDTVCAELRQRLETTTNEVHAAIAEEKRRAEEYRQLFLEEKDKHQQALELVADWQAQRIFGRQIFRHAPLLQPEKPPTREHVPMQRSARDQVREETNAFRLESIQRFQEDIDRKRRAQQAAGDFTSASLVEDATTVEPEAKKFFEGVLDEHAASQQLDEKLSMKQ